MQLSFKVGGGGGYRKFQGEKIWVKISCVIPPPTFKGFWVSVCLWMVAIGPFCHFGFTDAHFSGKKEFEPELCFHRTIWILSPTQFGPRRCCRR
jgi:hypothetical protein